MSKKDTNSLDTISLEEQLKAAKAKIKRLEAALWTALHDLDQYRLVIEREVGYDEEED